MIYTQNPPLPTNPSCDVQIIIECYIIKPKQCQLTCDNVETKDQSDGEKRIKCYF